jgi:hypothetical protein
MTPGEQLLAATPDIGERRKCSIDRPLGLMIF